MKKNLFLFSMAALGVAASSFFQKIDDAKGTALQPDVVTDPVPHDSDDPAIWINKAHPDQSLIVGTDKSADGGLYVFDLAGKNIPAKNITGLKRPNNVDVAYGLQLAGKPTDIAVVTERETGRLRIFSLPDMRPVDNGGLAVFEGESQRSPMGIALYHCQRDGALYAIVSRKKGPPDGYLWQYKLTDDGTGQIKGEPVRKFGKFSGKKEIESIAVDNELGYVYYSDEKVGVHKYYADPAKGSGELALFGTGDFTEDVEGISIYKTSPATGYILVSDQEANRFVVYLREGSKGGLHQKIAVIDMATRSSDGSEVTAVNLGGRFPKGLFVAMSEKKIFHYYDWRQLEKQIQEQRRP